MRILYHFRTRGTGAEAVHISGISQAFERMGHSVTFSSPSKTDPRATAGASPFKARGEGILARWARRVPGWLFELLEMGYNLPAAWRNWALLRQGQFDMVYERHAFFLFSTAWLARRFRIPFVVEVNELAGDSRVRDQPWFCRWVRWSDRVTFGHARLIVVVSPHLARRIAALGVPSDKILVLPNAVDEADYATLADGSAVRRQFGLEGLTVIGFVGWFVPWHRLDLLLQAMPILAEKHPNVRLFLVGEGPLREDLQDQAGRLGIADRVVFAGPVAHVDMPGHIAAMDVCVVPHSNEYRSPIKLFEYLGQGRAVVAPRTEPIAMVLRHGENGLLFEAESKEGLRLSLEQALGSPSLRLGLGQQARHDVLSHHTWRDNARAVLDHIRERSVDVS